MTMNRLRRVAKVKAALLLLTALLSILSVYSVQQAMSEPVTWTVDDNGSANFQTVQEAINAAQQGDSIIVKSGVYSEHVTVNKSVSIAGEDRGTTVIDGDGTDTVVLVTANNVILEGFTIRNGRNGIIVSAARNCTIRNNLVEDNKNRGILINNSRNCTLNRNHVVRTQSMYGMNVNSSRNILVEENAASGNYFDGVGLFSSSNNIMRGNTVNDNNLFGIVVDSHSNNNTIHHNNFFNNSIQVGSSNPTNNWDNGAEGNYWSDYGGVDANGDGVGDESFVVDEQTLQRDRFPLMCPYVNEVYLSVDTKPPVASFTCSPDLLFVNETVSFDASESYDSVGRNAIVGYNWDFGDGSTGTGIQVNHTYLAPENFTVVLTAVDVAGNEGIASVDIMVGLKDMGGEQSFSTTSVGIMVVGVAVGVTMLVFWFKRRKKPPK
jgi:parallel beta-helix repeat protein